MDRRLMPYDSYATNDRCNDTYFTVFPPINTSLLPIADDNESTPDDDEESGPLQLSSSQLSVSINGYISPILVLFTVVTNAFVCAVLLRPGMRTPTNVLLVAMAVSDTLTGLSPLPCYLYFYTLGNYVDVVPYGWCYLYNCLSEHLPTLFHTASVWLTVALGVHRYICVCRSPETRRRPASVNSAVYIIVGVYCATIVSQACRFFETVYHPYPVTIPAIGQMAENATETEYDEDDANETASSLPARTLLGCKPVFAWWVQSHENVYFNVYYWFRVVFIHLIPCSTLVAVNATLVRAMRTADRRRKKLLSAGGGAGIQQRQQPMHQRRKSECRRLTDANMTTAMLVAVVGVFLLVEFPLAVLFILVIVENSFPSFQLIDPDVGDTASMFINLLIQFSYSTNFFIYCGMSAQFRTILVQMFGCCCGGSSNSNGGFVPGLAIGRRGKRLPLSSEFVTEIDRTSSTLLPAAGRSNAAGNGFKPLKQGNRATLCIAMDTSKILTTANATTPANTAETKDRVTNHVAFSNDFSSGMDGATSTGPAGDDAISVLVTVSAEQPTTSPLENSQTSV